MEFKYTAADKQGKRVTATAIVDSMPLLVGHLRQQGLTPVSIEVLKTGAMSTLTLFSRSVKVRELAVFSRQLSVILKSGIVLTEALATITEDMENIYFRDTILDILAGIYAGGSFSEGLLRYPRIFPEIFSSLVKTGEEVGDLGRALENLARYMEDYENMREKVVTAFRYPMLVFGFMVVIMSVMVLLIIPRFSAMFINAGSRLPLLTRIVVGTSSFALNNAAASVAILLGSWVLGWYLLTVFRIRFTWEYCQLNLPVFGPIIRKIILGRFCRTLSTLLMGGVNIVVSLRVANEATNNLFFRQVFEDVRHDVISGVALTEAIKPYPEIPRLLVRMVAIGERSGNLDEMLTRTADYYEEEVSLSLNKMTAMIEPLLIIFIGIVVLTVALALYLPIFNLSMAVH